MEAVESSGNRRSKDTETLEWLFLVDNSSNFTRVTLTKVFEIFKSKIEAQFI